MQTEERSCSDQLPDYTKRFYYLLLNVLRELNENRGMPSLVSMYHIMQYYGENRVARAIMHFLEEKKLIRRERDGGKQRVYVTEKGKWLINNGFCEKDRKEWEKEMLRLSRGLMYAVVSARRKRKRSRRRANEKAREIVRFFRAMEV
jgi:predicted transcriptional regulator